MLEFYAAIKDAIGNDTGLGNTILHIHGGMLVFLIARLISGRSIGTFLPFTAVLVLELLNEGIDRINHGSWRWDDTLIDLVSTLFWPFVLSVAVRLRPDRREISPRPLS
jgi:hypothetical protein